MAVRIVIVGGASGDREEAGRILRASAYAVREAAGIVDAEDCLDPAPDVILLNDEVGGATLPVMYERLRSRAALADTPILLLASPSRESEIRGLIDPGICDVVRKPVSAVELPARVRALLHIRSLAEEVKRQRGLLDAMSITDTLTGLANDRYLLKRMDEEILRCQRFNLPLSFLIVEIDGYEDLGKRDGPEFRDRVVRHVAGLLDHLLRRIDLLSRYDESRFCALLPATGLYHAGLAAEKLRMGVEMSPLKIDQEEVSCTVSSGIAGYPDCGGTAEEIIRAASDALARAGTLGGNRIAVAPVTASTKPAQ